METLATQDLPETQSRPMPGAGEVLDRAIVGMTCASCVGRVERALGAVDGVSSAVVNLATERATIQFDPARTTELALGRAVEAAGYAMQPAPSAAPRPADARPDEAPPEDPAARALTRDFALAAALTVPLLVLGMSHGAIPGADGPLGRAPSNLVRRTFGLRLGGLLVRSRSSRRHRSLLKSSQPHG